MLLSKIVDAVNAKSFGETSWTYSDIKPYFAQAIAEINGEVEAFRRIDAAPDVSEDTPYYSIAAYNAIPDTHILNYVVTFIVVAMDNAQLAVTSRTQSYASQLAKYKQQLIADLYKWMPLRDSSNVYFDLEHDGKNTNRIPEVGRCWYSEDEGGMLSCRASAGGTYATNPTIGVHCENPYGYLVPRDPSQRILEGEYYYNYVFVPFAAFREHYDPVGVRVAIKGYDIPYTDITYTSIEHLNVKHITNTSDIDNGTIVIDKDINMSNKTIGNVKVTMTNDPNSPATKAYVDALQTAIDALVGTDITTFASQFEQLKNSYNTFMSGSSADDVINTLSEIQASLANKVTASEVRSIIDSMFRDISEVEF